MLPLPPNLPATGVETQKVENPDLRAALKMGAGQKGARGRPPPSPPPAPSQHTHTPPLPIAAALRVASASASPALKPPPSPVPSPPPKTPSTTGRQASWCAASSPPPTARAC